MLRVTVMTVRCCCWAQHEQNFCPGGTYWHKGDGQWGTQCSADHYALDFANYIIWEAQTLTKMATELGLKPRAEFWTAVAVSMLYSRLEQTTLLALSLLAGLRCARTSTVPLCCRRT